VTSAVGITIEHVNNEVQKLGSAIRSMSIQIASMRARVSDLEGWDASAKRWAKSPPPKGKPKGKPKGEPKGKPYGKARKR
jgi:hypothetical protein